MKGVSNMKVLKEVFKGFAIKKLLLSILCSIIVTTFVGFTILFVKVVPSYALAEICNEVNGNSEELKEMGNYMQELYNTSVKESFAEEKEKYGENYPAEGIFIYFLMNYFNSVSICKVYTLTLLIGTILGALVYIIFIQNATGIRMILEATICGIFILLILVLVNWCYKLIINNAINKIGVGNQNNGNIGYVYDINSPDILYIFIGIIGIAYIINLIYQKILANKFNKKLKSTK